MSDEWTIRTALEWTQGYLQRKGDENPRLSAQWIMSAATGLSRIELYADYDRPLTVPERKVLRDRIERRVAGEPLQYLKGSTGFRFIDVLVRKGVLIPRPETEVLVGEALALLPAEGEAVVADLCTGTGCIACALASERPATRVFAVDISPDAYALACENVAALNLSDAVTVLQGDLGEQLDACGAAPFDLIVSNPPYVPTAVVSEQCAQVTAYEPELALDGGADGLDLFRRMVPWAFASLKPGGAFAVELFEESLDEAADIAREQGFTDVRIVHDLAQKPRVLTCRK